MTKITPPILESVRLEPQEPANTAIIWLHGLGADGYNFVPVAQQLRQPEGAHIRYILPHAPVMPVTLNNGMHMPAWFDLKDLTLETRADEAGLRAAAEAIDNLIQEQIDAGIPARRIFIAGFSQGGALALHVGLRYPQRLGGIIALSTYLPLSEVIAHETSEANREVPIFMVHGVFDPVIQLRWAEISKEHLERLGYPVSWHTFPMQHEVNYETILTLDLWLAEQIKN